MASHPHSLARCMFAELLGTFLLVFFGCGAVHVAVLTGDLTGLWQVGVVWAIAIMAAIYTVGAVSGAHINPAITVGLASWNLFPRGRVVPYLAAQFVGAFLAAALLYSVFNPYLLVKESAKGIVRGEPGSELTAMCYGEYFPNPGGMAGHDERYDAEEHARLNLLVTEQSAFLIEVVGTAILALVVTAVSAPGNRVSPGALAPLFIGLTVAGLICVIAPLTQACFNPARDFGPRVFAYFAGWRSIAIPGPRGMGFLTVYILAPLVGGVAGVGIYQCVLRDTTADSSTKDSEP